jgi:hypothetical protein
MSDTDAVKTRSEIAEIGDFEAAGLSPVALAPRIFCCSRRPKNTPGYPSRKVTGNRAGPVFTRRVEEIITAGYSRSFERGGPFTTSGCGWPHKSITAPRYTLVNDNSLSMQNKNLSVTAQSRLAFHKSLQATHAGGRPARHLGFEGLIG